MAHFVLGGERLALPYAGVHDRPEHHADAGLLVVRREFPCGGLACGKYAVEKVQRLLIELLAERRGCASGQAAIPTAIPPTILTAMLIAGTVVAIPAAGAFNPSFAIQHGNGSKKQKRMG